MKPAIVVWGAFWILLAAHACLNYFAVPFAYPVWSSLVFAAVVWIMICAGRRILSLFATASGEMDFWLEIAVSATLGLVVVTYSAAALGFFKLLYPQTAVLLLIALLVLGRNEGIHILRRVGILMKGHGSSGGMSQRFYWYIPVLIILVVTFFTSWAPIHQYDSLVYHMALPQTYVVRHAITAIPENMYSHFPQNAEMLFTLGLLLKSDLIAQMMTWLSFALSLAWIYSVKDRFSSSTVGFAALLAASHTSLMLLSSITYVESFVMLWITASVISVLKWNDAPAGEKQAWFWAILAGIFAGAGLGTKYYAGICVAGIILMGLFKAFTETTRTERKTRFLQAAACSAAAFLLFAPWAVKNMIEVGNPVFPFFYKMFSSAKAGISIDQASGYFKILTEYGHAGNFLKSLLEFPYLVLKNPLRYGGGIDVLGGLGWELVFASIPLMALSAFKRPSSRWMAVYLIFHWAVWFSTGKILRFLVVIVPLSSILAADGFLILWKNNGKFLKAVLLSGTVVFITVRILLFSYVHHVFQTPMVLLGLESRPEYLSRKLHYYPCAHALAQRGIPKTAKVLFIGEQRTYHTGRESCPTSIFGRNQFVRWADESPDWKSLKETLVSDGFTHMLFVPKEANRIKGYGTFDFSRRGLDNWKNFSRNGLEPVYSTEDCFLYKIKKNIGTPSRRESIPSLGRT